MSLRARLLLALGAAALIALVAADVATYSSLRTFLISRVDQQLQAAGQGPGLGSGQESGPGGQPRFAFPPDCASIQTADQGVFVEIQTSSGHLTCPYTPLGGGTGSSPKLPSSITDFTTTAGSGGQPTKYFTASSTTDGGPSFRVRASELDGGGIFIVALPLTDTYGTLNHLLIIELAVTGGALVLAGLIGWYLVRVGLRPLAAIETTAATVAEGELGHRVPGESKRTEVGRLAGVLNLMLKRIEDAFAARDATENQLRASEGRMRQFVSDASHELRTPLAAVSAYAELFDRGASERPEDLGRVMTGIRSETSRMGHLVDDLLLLARMDEGRPLEKVPVEFVGLTAEAVHAARAVGPQWPIELVASEPIEMIGDPTRLRQVIDNLLANVRAHTPVGTRVRVSVTRSNGDLVLEVADDGPGIDSAVAERLFERFYRADSSRARASGGTGLGLSIVDAIVGNHGGTVTARQRDGGGSVFSVAIPLAVITG